MEKKTWSRLDLEDYVNNFTENQRENVLAQIVEADLLRQIFETTEGKVVLNSAVDIIASNVMRITGLCIGTDENKIDKITQAGYEINVVYKMMTRWATMLKTGKDHEEKIKRGKNK